MENSRKIFFITETVLAVMLVLVSFAMLHEKNGRKQERISVIVRDSDASRWTAFRYGLKMAAEDQQIELSVVSTEQWLTVEEEQRLIEQEIENGADAVIVEPVSGAEAQEILEKTGKKIPVMLVCNHDFEKKEDLKLPVTEADHYAMGTELAQELLKDCGGTLEGKKLGIVAEAEGADTEAGRQKGFTDALKGSGGQIVWETANRFEEDPAFLQEQPGVDFVIALDDESLVTAGRASAANDLHGALVYGIGNSTEAVYYLDSGSVECLIVPDGFKIGYQSLTETAEKLGSMSAKMENQTVPYAVIRREELFSEENQEILFTMNQY